MLYEESQIVPHKSAKFKIFPITNSRLSASLVLNCINFLFQNFWFLIFFGKKYALQKKVYWTNFVQFWILYSDIFFLAKIPYFNYQINSHLTKKDTMPPSAYGVIAWEPSIANESRFKINFFQKSQVGNSELQSANKQRKKFRFSIQNLTSQLTIGNCQMGIHLVVFLNCAFLLRAHPADRSQ